MVAAAGYPLPCSLLESMTYEEIHCKGAEIKDLHV